MDPIAKPTLNPACSLKQLKQYKENRALAQERVNDSETHHVPHQFPHLYVQQHEADAVLPYIPCFSFETETIRNY